MLTVQSTGGISASIWTVIWVKFSPFLRRFRVPPLCLEHEDKKETQETHVLQAAERYNTGW